MIKRVLSSAVLSGISVFAPTLIVYFCFGCFSSIQHLRAQSEAVFRYIEPVSTLIFSMVTLHERLTIIQVVGAILILGDDGFGEFFRISRF